MTAADRHLSVHGARLRYRDEGVGAAVVMVHGWALDLDIWEPQAPLATTFRMVRFDRRGFGLSTGQASLSDDVEDLRALIATLGLGQPLLVGMSQGARVVLEFALRHPHLARALMLDGAPPRGRSDLPMRDFREAATRHGLDTFRRLWSAHPLTALHTSDATMHALLARVLARYPGGDLLADWEESLPAPGDAQLAGLDIPVQIINGAHDLESRRNAGADWCAALHGAIHTTLADAGHMPNLDTPHQYNQIVNEFARRHLPAAA